MLTGPDNVCDLVQHSDGEMELCQVTSPPNKTLRNVSHV
jgi:hypothetical protein